MRSHCSPRSSCMALAIAAAIGCADPAAARDPAVSTTNLKLAAAAGSSGGDSAWLGIAGLTAPLGPMWGAQGEAGVIDVGSDSTLGLGGHVFKRDPDSYLAGVFLAYANEDEFGLEATRLGTEAEFYLGQVTVLLKAGYQFADLIDDTAFGEAELHWYASDNFRLGGGVSFDRQAALGHAGAEWLIGNTSLPGLALRTDAFVGDNDYDSVTAGITYYFGTDASLKDRHRRQDPDSALFDLFQALERDRPAPCPQQQVQQFKSGPTTNNCNVPPPPT